MKFLTLLLLFIFSYSINAKIVVVTNKNSDINHLSKESIKYLYLAKVNKINNIIIKPLLSKDDILHKKFISEIIGKDIHQYSSYWARLVFTGRKAIPRRLSNQEIKTSLKELNTIIYMRKESLNTNYKIIYEQ